MRLMRISTAYDGFVRSFYAQRPELAARPFREQYETIIDEPYGWCDLWTRFVGPLGYECFEPMTNIQPAQFQWAKENNVEPNPADWFLPLTMAQIEWYKPDVLICNDYASFNYDFLTETRKRVPSIRVIVGWCGAPYRDEKVFSAYDLTLTNLKCHIERFRAIGVNAAYMHHGFDPAILGKIDTTRPKQIDFSFVGSIVKRPGFHNERERLLLALLEKTDLTIFADLPPRSKETARVARRVAAVVRALPGGRRALGLVPRLRHLAEAPSLAPSAVELADSIYDASRPSAFGRAMYQAIRDSKLTLNTHIDAAKDNASNMRMFEATGVGTCMLTERQSDLAEIFEPDREVVTYSSHEECVEKAVWLLNHDKEREAIGLAGQKRVMKDHRWDQRALWLDGQIRALLTKRA